MATKEYISLVIRNIQLLCCTAIFSISITLEIRDEYSDYLYYLLLSALTWVYLMITIMLFSLIPPLALTIMEIAFFINWAIILGFVYISFLPYYCENTHLNCRLGLGVLIVSTILATSFLLSMTIIITHVTVPMSKYTNLELRRFSGCRQLVGGGLFLRSLDGIDKTMTI